MRSGFIHEPLGLPAILWVELTSRCPFRCNFCSRQMRRGNGEEMDFGVYRSLISQLQRPQIIRLNYSGESIHYSHLIEAIGVAAGTGAWTEIVTAFASIQTGHIQPLVASGLDRITISLHTTDRDQFREIYGHSDFDSLRIKLAELVEIKRRMTSRGPELDFAFVAMRGNLDQLASVARYARDLGVPAISVHPVIRRDPIPEIFLFELGTNNRPTSQFRELLSRAVSEARSLVPEVAISVASPILDGEQCIGESPVYSEDLPPGARIHSCDQSPFETVHVLANGDIVACEVTDRLVLGNLRQDSLAAIWHGEPYRRFRAAYVAGSQAQCQTCPWKQVYYSSAPVRRVDVAEGSSAQFLTGWHSPGPDEQLIWSRGESSLVLANDSSGGTLTIAGALPPPASAQRKSAIKIRAGSYSVGRIENVREEILFFRNSFHLPDGLENPLQLTFVPKQLFWPVRERYSKDTRSLGFALQWIELIPPAPGAWDRIKMAGLNSMLACGDAFADMYRWLAGPRRRRSRSRPFQPGISIVIPERGNPALVRACLKSVGDAAACVSEPVEIVIVVNGSRPEDYADLRTLHPAKWIFVSQPMGFVEAISRGVSIARYDWVYLLNSDMLMNSGTLTELLPWREEDVFAIGSQIFFQNSRQRREETNWTDFEIRNEKPVIFDALPEQNAASSSAWGSLYAGGGSSLFRKDLLRKMLKPARTFDPFYWEDVEWGAVAWRNGFRVLFCPRSHVWHAHRATVSRFYDEREVARIWRRNQLIFQLRNLREATPARTISAHLIGLDARSRSEILSLRRLAGLFRARLNHAFYAEDENSLRGRRDRQYSRIP